MALAIIVGALSGALSLLPLYAGLRVAGRMDAQTSAMGYTTPVLLAIGGSLVILALATVICMVVARDVALYFVLAEAAVLVIGALGYGIGKALRK